MCASVRRLLHERRHLVAVVLGHADIRQDDVRRLALDPAAIASRPSLTVTTRMSSSANVSSMTRRIVRLSSASSSVCGTVIACDRYFAAHDLSSGLTPQTATAGHWPG